MDPATIFNSAMFYYVVKGIPLAWGEIPNAFSRIGSRFAVEDYPLVATYILLGIISWNWAYRMTLNSLSGTWPQISNPAIATLNSELKDLGFGIFMLSTIGIASFSVLFWKMKQNIFIFLTEPVQRAYLADATYGPGVSSGYIWLYGVFMLPIASIVWLVDLGRRKQRISFSWYVHALVCVTFLLLVSPRAHLVGYAVSILIVYVLLIGRLGLLRLGLISVSVILYASFTTIWRGVVGAMQTPTIEAGIFTLTQKADLTHQFIKFFGSLSLADIRIFLLVESFYGKGLPLKYGGTLTRVVTQLIPRALWPGKPYDLGTEIGHLYDPSTISGSPPGFFAEMYMNFHVAGVLIGGMLLGGFLAVLYHTWILKGHNAKDIVLYAILAPRIFLLPSSTFANMVLTVVILSVAAVFTMSVLPNLISKSGRRI